MPRRSKQPNPATDPPDAASAEPDMAVMQVKVWLVGISPMVWRRLQVPGTCTLRELHGMIQIAMGWEGIHLYQFCLRSRRYGSWEVSASSPDVTLAALKLRRGTRFTYEYDLNIPWRHEIRIEENQLHAEPGTALPRCIAGDGACPPEDCGGPENFMTACDGRFSLDALEDLDTMMEIFQRVVAGDGSDILSDILDQEARSRLEEALGRAKEREAAQGQPFSQRSVNTRLRKGEYLDLMHQQY